MLLFPYCYIINCFDTKIMQCEFPSHQKERHLPNGIARCYLPPDTGGVGKLGRSKVGLGKLGLGKFVFL